jgi:hypothetical protein
MIIGQALQHKEESEMSKTKKSRPSQRTPKKKTIRLSSSYKKGKKAIKRLRSRN